MTKQGKLNILQQIDPFYFILALAIGLFFVYITNDNVPDVILMYPTPENAGKVVYKDSADVCYKYQKEEVECPENKSQIKQLPIQHTVEQEGGDGILDKLKKLFG